MAHHAIKQVYQDLATRLDKFPQGAPPSQTLFKILSMLFTEDEARVASLLPLRPFSVTRASKVLRMDLPKTKAVLEGLADKGILVDLSKEDKTLYVLAPPMAGFFEFSLMRVREDLDQKTLSELFTQYLNQEDSFFRDLFNPRPTQAGRMFVVESALSSENALHVLDYERASHIISSASQRAVGMCYCRHKARHLGKACDAPMDICMTFNGAARSLVKHGFAREIDSRECLDLLQTAHEHDLVQFGENAQNEVSFICNCCPCCCDAMVEGRRFGFLNPIQTTNYIPEVNEATCKGCGKCSKVCPMEALSPGKPVKLDASACLGCGICVRKCGNGSITLKSRPQRVISPKDSVHRVVLMALERGKLQHLIFDNQAYRSHRVMAAILGAILAFPPVKRVLASQQLHSRFLSRFAEF